MPTITLAGMAFIILGGILVAFTPKERIVNVVSAPSWGTMIAVMNAEGTIASAATVPFGESGKVLAWDAGKKMYRWVEAPSDPQ
jgi:hypothetical protein